MPEELWMEAHNNCKGGDDQIHPKEKEMQKWLSKESLPIAVKRKEAKDKGERERYTQLNVEFQRIARREKKALSEQCKEIEEKFFKRGKA